MYKQLAWLLAGTLIGKCAMAPKCKEIFSKSAKKAAGMATVFNSRLLHSFPNRIMIAENNLQPATKER
jgi:hypothetical protein